MSYDELTPETRKNMTETLNDPNMLEAIWKPNLFFGKNKPKQNSIFFCFINYLLNLLKGVGFALLENVKVLQNSLWRELFLNYIRKYA